MANARNRRVPGEGTRRRLHDTLRAGLNGTERKRRWRASEAERVANIQARVRMVSEGESERAMSASLEQSTSRYARKLGYALQRLTSQEGVEYQRMVLRKLLQQPILQQGMPPSVTDERKLLQCQAVCDSIAKAWSTLKFGRGTDHFRARNALQAAVASVSDGVAVAGLTRCLGLNKRSALKGVKHRRQFDANEGDGWGRFNRNKRRDAIPEESRHLIEHWWTVETRVSPISFEVVKNRLGVKNFEIHKRHYLEESEVDFYTRFLAANPNAQVGLSSFSRLKPYFVYN